MWPAFGKSWEELPIYVCPCPIGFALVVDTLLFCKAHQVLIAQLTSSEILSTFQHGLTFHTFKALHANTTIMNFIPPEFRIEVEIFVK